MQWAAERQLDGVAFPRSSDHAGARVAPAVPRAMEAEVEFGGLLEQVQAILRGRGKREAKLQSICDLLRDGVSHYAWVGFYMADEAELVLRLGPYAGAPTEHVTIPYGSGICGQVAVLPQTFVVQDVTAQQNYLSCSIEVRSEIVVPIFREGAFVAQLDIDSHEVSPFTEEDLRFLEAVCGELAHLWGESDVQP